MANWWKAVKDYCYLRPMETFPFTKSLFWDVDVSSVDLERHKRFIVERVLTRGRLEDFNKLLTLYSTEDIKAAIRKSRELDPKTAHFCSWYFGLLPHEINASSFYR